MEITERELRRMVADVDERHHEGMRTFRDGHGELIFGERSERVRTSRRRFLAGSAAGGALVTIGSATTPLSRFVNPAAAQAGPTDEELATFAASVEFAAVAAYGAAADSGLVTTPAVGEAASTFAGHHQQHGEAFAAFVGRDDIEANPGLVEMVSAELGAATDEPGVLQIAFDLENAAASTYTFALGVIETQEAVDAMASILPVEAQHAVTLGLALGLPVDDADLMPVFEPTDKALDPADLPVS